MVIRIRKIWMLVWLGGLLLLVSCSSVRQARLPANKEEAADTIYVTRRGWHTGILIPAAALDSLFPSIQKQMPGATHVAFSWGDRRYFMAEEGTRTCNVWTARALKRAGVDIHPALSLTAGRVMRQLKEQK